MGLLEQRAAGGSWLVTPGAGRAFLELWDSEEHKPPKYFLLAQLLRYDRTLLIPFLERFVNDPTGDGPIMLAQVWGELWKHHRNEMSTLEPPVPISLWHENGHKLKRTAKHHFEARVRFLIKPEGLHMDASQSGRLAKAFWDSKDSRLPSDHFFKIGWAVAGTHPESVSKESLHKLSSHAYSRLHRAGFVSAQGAFGFVNEMALPTHAVGWDEFVTFLRSEESITIHPSVHRDDLLYAPNMRQEVGSN